VTLANEERPVSQWRNQSEARANDKPESQTSEGQKQDSARREESFLVTRQKADRDSESEDVVTPEEEDRPAEGI